MFEFNGIISPRMAKKNLLAIFLVLAGFGLIFLPARARSATPIALVGQESSPTATIAPSPEPLIEPLDQPTRDRLRSALVEQKLGPISIANFLKHAIRAAIDKGVPTNTIVLIFLLPLIGTIVGALYYLVGLTGFGIFMPAMISVSFLATGITGGLLLFGMILFLTSVVRRLLRKIRLHQRSRRTIVLWVVSLGTFVLLFLAPNLHLFDLTKISIFPILFLILLSEEFVRAQMGKSKRGAINLTLGTLLIAIVGAILMGWDRLQELVILHPELSLLTLFLLNLFIGRYTGFRLLEYRRFKPVLRR